VGEEVVAALLRLDDKFIKLEDIPRIRDLVPTAEVRVRVRVRVRANPNPNPKP